MDLTCTIPAAGASIASWRAYRWRRWFIPDLALTVSLLTLIYCLVFFDGTRQLFRDSDAGWHIRTGESILSGNGLPHTDPYSFSRSGKPWLAWEWGADVLAGAAHLAGGPAFVAGLYAAVLGASTYLWFRLSWACGGNFLLAGAMSILLLTTCSIHWHARPHLFGWVLLLISVLCVETWSFTWSGLLAIALLSVFWANLHASFFLLPVILLIYSGACGVRSLVWTGFVREDDLRAARWYAAGAAVALCASLINPSGYALHFHVFSYLTNRELLDRIGEFQSFNFHAEGAGQILLTLGLAAFGGCLALIQRKLAHFSLVVLFLVLSLRSARALPLLALLALPLANGSITQGLSDWRDLQPSLRRRLDDFLRYSANLRALDLSLSGSVILPVVLAATFAVLRLPAAAGHAGFDASVFPVAAAAQLQLLPANARILAPDMYGGYLIYRLNGARKVWFDGRSDFYGADFMKDYLRLVELRPGWRELVARWRFSHALLPNRYSLIPALESAGWKRLYSDEVATLLASPVK